MSWNSLKSLVGLGNRRSRNERKICRKTKQININYL